MLNEMAAKVVDDWKCSVARSMTVLGERWTILILREALLGTTRFADFESNLGLPPDRLADRRLDRGPFWPALGARRRLLVRADCRGGGGDLSLESRADRDQRRGRLKSSFKAA